VIGGGGGSGGFVSFFLRLHVYRLWNFPVRKHCFYYVTLNRNRVWFVGFGAKSAIVMLCSQIKFICW